MPHEGDDVSEPVLDPALDPTLDQLSRRTLLGRAGIGTAAAFGVAAGCVPQEKKSSALEDEKLTKEEITFDSGGTKIKGFLVRSKESATKAGSVIVVHEIFGVTPHIKDVTARLAQQGYTALAVDFFTREGTPPPLEGGFGPLMQFVGKISDAQIIGDVRAAVTYLKARPASNDRVGLVGFCWGGNVAMLSAAEVPGLNASVCYYGRIRTDKSANKPQSPLDLVPEMKAPLMGHFGALDNGIPVKDVEALRDALKEKGKTAEFHIYEKAGHAFNNDTRESYVADAAKESWSRTSAWFEKYLKG